jgi:Rrf2 family protein
MKLSGTVRYGFKMVVDIAQNGKSTKREICARQKVPSDYAANIACRLCRHGIIHSIQGPTGGYVLKKTPENISLLDILEAVNGRIVFRDSAKSAEGFWKTTEERVRQTLSTCTLDKALPFVSA